VKENPAYLTAQLLTYLGNKRALLPFLEKGVGRVQKRLGRKKLSIFDAFSGSGIVARL
jgi:adenine-specific DNA-methyltransferase